MKKESGRANRQGGRGGHREHDPSFLSRRRGRILSYQGVAVWKYITRIWNHVHRRDKLEAAPRHGQDKPALPRRLTEHLAQGKDALVEIVLFDHSPRPDRLHQGGLLYQLARALHEVSQCFKGAGRQRDGLAPWRREHLQHGIKAKALELATWCAGLVHSRLLVFDVVGATLRISSFDQYTLSGRIPTFMTINTILKPFHKARMKLPGSTRPTA